MKTGQVNPDRPHVGPSVNTFVGTFVGSPCRDENKQINPRGGSRGRTRGATHGPTRGATRGSNFAFACSVHRPFLGGLPSLEIRLLQEHHLGSICCRARNTLRIVWSYFFWSHKFSLVLRLVLETSYKNDYSLKQAHLSGQHSLFSVHMSTPNMTGQRLHRTMEMISALPW